MDDDEIMDEQLVETDYDRSGDDRYRRDYDEVFLPDGSLLQPMSVLDDPPFD